MHRKCRGSRVSLSVLAVVARAPGRLLEYLRGCGSSFRLYDWGMLTLFHAKAFMPAPSRAKLNDRLKN